VRAELVALDGAGERFELRLRIEAGHHIHAHDPGAPGLIGLDASPRDAGVQVEVAWPAGDIGPLGARVHAAALAIPLRVLAPRPTPRPLRLSVRWQCCTDRACQPPEDVALEA
jgi:hypothetical protein